jgi:hypothetical protein
MNRIADIKFFSVPFRATGQDVQCASLDGKTCWSAGPCADKLKKLAAAPTAFKVLTCGESHRKVWGFTGYDQPRHWCSQLLRFYADPVRYCELLGQVWDPKLPQGCQPDWEDCETHATWYVINRCKSQGTLLLAAVGNSDPDTSFTGWDDVPYLATYQSCATAQINPRLPENAVPNTLYHLLAYSVANKAPVSAPRAALCQDGEALQIPKSLRENACVLNESVGISMQWDIHYWPVDFPKDWAAEPYSIKLTNRKANSTEVGHRSRAKKCDASLHPKAQLLRGSYLPVDPYRMCKNSSTVVFVDC